MWFREMMLFIKEWWFLVSVMFGTFIGAYKGVNLINDTLKEIKFELKSWNSRMESSESDRKLIHAELDDHDERIDNHEVRISVLESHTGIKKLNYKEVYGKEKDY